MSPPSYIVLWDPRSSTYPGAGDDDAVDEAVNNSNAADCDSERLLFGHDAQNESSNEKQKRVLQSKST